MDRPPLLRPLIKVTLLFAVPAIVLVQPFRLSLETANAWLGGLLILFSPWIANFMLFKLGRKWAIVLGGVLCIPLVLYTVFAFIVFSFVAPRFKDGKNLSFEKFAESDWNGSMVRLYRTNDGATTPFGVVIRQERSIAPGLLIIRTLDSFYDCSSLNLANNNQGVVVNAHKQYCPSFGHDQQIYKLKRFVFF